jgi:hypothetical protein
MGDLVVHLNLQEREVDQVLTAATPYLSSLQPAPLQVYISHTAEMLRYAEVLMITVLWGVT